MVMTGCALSSRRLLGRLRRLHRPDAVARLGYVLLPVAVAVDDGRLDQDYHLALGVGPAALPEKIANAGLVAQSGDLRGVVRALLAHQAADRHDVAVLHAHDGVRLVDAAGSERQGESA